MKKIVFEGTEEQIENLKRLVVEKNYYNIGSNILPKMREDYQTENLWSVGDMENWDCNDEQALDILHDALTNDTTMESIWFAIDFYAEDRGIKKVVV
jgi:hypothetical protein